jgi:hypothetical protein
MPNSIRFIRRPKLTAQLTVLKFTVLARWRYIDLTMCNPEINEKHHAPLPPQCFLWLEIIKSKCYRP